MAFFVNIAMHSLKVNKIELHCEFVETVSELKIIPHAESCSIIQSQRIANKNNIEVSVNASSCVFLLHGKGVNDTVCENNTVIKDAFFDIKTIWINGVLMEKWALEKLVYFKPIYSQSELDYAKNTGLTLAETVTGQWRFFYNGYLCFDLENFFLKYHSNLLCPFQEYNHWVVNSHLGYISPEKKQLFDDLYQQI